MDQNTKHTMVDTEESTATPMNRFHEDFQDFKWHVYSEIASNHARLVFDPLLII